MRILFLHPNFPAQFWKIAQALASNPRNEIVFLTKREDGEIAGVRKVLYTLSREVAEQTHPYLKSYETGDPPRPGRLPAMVEEKKRGFYPDVIYGHSGWGTTLFLRDLFPRARFLANFEWFYNAHGADSDFDPAERLPPTTRRGCASRTRRSSWISIRVTRAPVRRSGSTRNFRANFSRRSKFFTRASTPPISSPPNPASRSCWKRPA